MSSRIIDQSNRGCQAIPSAADPPYPPDPLPPILLGGSVNVMAGAPGTGKTALIADVLRQFRDQEPVFGLEPAAGALEGIGVVTADRSWRKSSKYWFDLVGFGDIPVYSIADDYGFVKARLRKKSDRILILDECLEKLHHKPNSLILVDPLAIFLGGALNDYDSCAVACLEIRDLCRRRQITIIGTAHAGKQKNDKADRYLRLQDRILGSAAQFGYTDTQMYLASPEETGKPYFTFLWHPHHAPAATFRLIQQKNGLFTTDGAPLPETEQTPGSLEIILTLFPGTDPISFGDLATAATHLPQPLSRATVHRWVMKAIEEGLVERVKYGVYRKRRMN